MSFLTSLSNNKFYNKYFTIIAMVVFASAYLLRQYLDERNLTSVNNKQIDSILSIPIVDKYVTNNVITNINYLQLIDSSSLKVLKNKLNNVNCSSGFKTLYSNITDNKFDRKLLTINCARILGATVIGENYWALQGINILQLDENLSQNLKIVTNGFSTSSVRQESFYHSKSNNDIEKIMKLCVDAMNNPFSLDKTAVDYDNFRSARYLNLLESCLIIDLVLDLNVLKI